MDEEVQQFQPHLSIKLVPWTTWDEWNFVRESLLSSSPQTVALGLRRVSAWRARGGAIPIAVEATSAIIEIHQKDPFFRDGIANDTLNSDEMLAMSYCMAIIRLVNGFLDKSCKDAKLSISESAEAFGIPRVLVDIRHESSHRGLSPLPLVRAASLKALDWLKSSYWEPQRNLIPNVRKETESRMLEMALFLKAKKIKQIASSKPKRKHLSSVAGKQSKMVFGSNKLFSCVPKMLHCPKLTCLFSKGLKKQRSTIGSIIRLYSLFPLEVVTLLLEFSLKAFDSSAFILNQSDDSQSETNLIDTQSCLCTLDDWKAIIIRFAKHEPALLLTMVEQVLVMIEAREETSFEIENLLSSEQTDIRQIELLSSLVPWLLSNMMVTKDSVSPESTEDNCTNTEDNCANIASNATLSQLFTKCLLLTMSGNVNLLDSALLIAKMMGNVKAVELVDELSLQSAPDPEDTFQGSTDDFELAFQQNEEFIDQAAKKLEQLLSHERTGKADSMGATGDVSEGKVWKVAESWSKCPIGMLPRTLGSSGALSILEKTNFQRQENHKPCVEEEDESKFPGKRGPICDLEFEKSLNVNKKMRETAQEDREIQDHQPDSSISPLEGRMLIGGVWRIVGEDELREVESGVRILV